MLVFNLSTGEEQSYSKQDPKEVLITTVAIEKYGATQIHSPQVSLQLATQIIEGNRSLAIGDWAVLKN